MARIERRLEAEADLDDIWYYIARHNIDAADRVIDGIERAATMLAASPLIGRSREELRPKLRSWTIGSYVAFYEPLPDGIILVRAVHGARDMEALFADEDQFE